MQAYIYIYMELPSSSTSPKTCVYEVPSAHGGDGGTQSAERLPGDRATGRRSWLLGAGWVRELGEPRPHSLRHLRRGAAAPENDLLQLPGDGRQKLTIFTWDR